MLSCGRLYSVEGDFGKLNIGAKWVLHVGVQLMHIFWGVTVYLFGHRLIISTFKIVKFYRYGCLGRRWMLPTLRPLSLRFTGDLSIWCREVQER
jgi:hypothetical protein